MGGGLMTGRFLVGGTEYMWDTRVPIWARLLSSFHIGLPLALLWAMRKIGYDRRALPLQAAIAAGLFVASRFFPAGVNMNYLYQKSKSGEHTSEIQSHFKLVFPLFLLKKKKNSN